MLKLKWFFKRLEVLKTILSLQKSKRLCNDVMNPDLTKADIFPIKGNTSTIHEIFKANSSVYVK